MPRFAPQSTTLNPERVILVGVETGASEWSIEESMGELARLVETDGGEVVAELVQRLDVPVARTYIGSGKADELKSLAKSLDADVVVFDDELTPSQQSNLERIVGSSVKIIDRTALILDIFAAHATTKEGRLQVQLAQANYLLPRLRGMWSHLVGEQTRGGIGSRFGQGESQLEVDRRLVRKRISLLTQQLKELSRQRTTQSKARWESGVYRVALVGYTNAGKSTLLNQVAGVAVYVKDELFATLDPTTRAVELDEGRKITVTDTVGFIQKLPTLLVESFKSTLAEAANADLILKVVDMSDPHAEKELAVVDAILKDIGADHIRSVTVCNKCDLISDEERRELSFRHPDDVFISALEGKGMRGLLFRIAQEAAKGDVLMTVEVPYGKGILMSMLHERCQIVREEYCEGGLRATAKVPERIAKTFEPYRIDR